MVDFVELSNKRTNSVRTIEELLMEFVPQTFNTNAITTKARLYDR